MKDVWLFIKWQYSKFEFWQKVFIVNMFAMGFTAFRTDEFSKAIFFLTMIIPLMFMIKWFVFDTTIESWKKFKQNKSNLFNTIKEGK